MNNTDAVGIYFSGTGNTKYCLERFMAACKFSEDIYSIEMPESVEQIKRHKFIVFAYPVYYSNLPKIVRDYITANKEIFRNKEIYIISTMGLFSGDGTGCSARLFKKYGANIKGGLHIKMPDCIGDVKALKKSLEQNKEIVKTAELKISEAAEKLLHGKPDKEGLGIFYHIAGLFGQRLYFPNKTKNYTDKLKIDHSKCIGCGKCVKICPMYNIDILNDKAVPKGKCTMCYRCINSCPRQALTLIGKEVIEQPLIEKYL